MNLATEESNITSLVYSCFFFLCAYTITVLFKSLLHCHVQPCVTNNTNTFAFVQILLQLNSCSKMRQIHMEKDCRFSNYKTLLLTPRLSIRLGKGGRVQNRHLIFFLHPNELSLSTFLPRKYFRKTRKFPLPPISVPGGPFFQ